MLSLFTRQGRVLLTSTLWGNRGTREFLAAKLIFLGFLLLAAGINWPVWAIVTVYSLVESGLAVIGFRRDRTSGVGAAKARREGLTRLALAACFGLFSWLFFSLLWLWLAVLLQTLIMLVLLVTYIVLHLPWLLKDMRGTASTDKQALFEQVRRMQDLDRAAHDLHNKLLTTTETDDRRDLTFYLAWAELYRGHRLLPTQLWDKAAQYYQAASKTDPSNIAAYASLAICYLQKAEFEPALDQFRQAIAIFNGDRRQQPYDQALWDWNRNEVSSEYEQSGGLLQLGALAVGKVQTSQESPANQQRLTEEFRQLVIQLPGRSREELNTLMSRKGGKVLNVLQLLAAGSFREPAKPLEMLAEAVTLPLLPIQTIEAAGSAA